MQGGDPAPYDVPLTALRISRGFEARWRSHLNLRRVQGLSLDVPHPCRAVTRPRTTSHSPPCASPGVSRLAGAHTSTSWVGLSYPGLYLRATTESPSLPATQLAAAAITTESFGGLVGSAAGAALPALSADLVLPRGDAFAWSYAGFALALALAAVAAARSVGTQRHD